MHVMFSQASKLEIRKIFSKALDCFLNPLKDFSAIYTNCLVPHLLNLDIF